MRSTKLCPSVPSPPPTSGMVCFHVLWLYSFFEMHTFVFTVLSLDEPGQELGFKKILSKLSTFHQPSRRFIVSFNCQLLFSFSKGTKSKAEQSVGSNTPQQFSPSGRCAVFHHHQPQPTGPWQKEDFPTVVSQNLHRLLSQSSLTWFIDFIYSEFCCTI